MSLAFATDVLADQPVVVTTTQPGGEQPVVVGGSTSTQQNPYVTTTPAGQVPGAATTSGGQQIIVVVQNNNAVGSIPPPAVGSLDTEGCKAYLAKLDAQIDSVRQQIRDASDAGDDARVYTLKEQLTELQKYRTAERDRLMVSNWGMVAGGAVSLTVGLIALPTALVLALANWQSHKDGYDAAAATLALTGLVTVPLGGALIGVGKADRSPRTEPSVDVQPSIGLGPGGASFKLSF